MTSFIYIGRSSMFSYIYIGHSFDNYTIIYIAIHHLILFVVLTFILFTGTSFNLLRRSHLRSSAEANCQFAGENYEIRLRKPGPRRILSYVSRQYFYTFDKTNFLTNLSHYPTKFDDAQLLIQSQIFFESSTAIITVLTS